MEPQAGYTVCCTEKHSLYLLHRAKLGWEGRAQGVVGEACFRMTPEEDKMVDGVMFRVNGFQRCLYVKGYGRITVVDAVVQSKRCLGDLLQKKYTVIMSVNQYHYLSGNNQYSSLGGK